MACSMVTFTFTFTSYFTVGEPNSSVSVGIRLRLDLRSSGTLRSGDW